MHYTVDSLGEDVELFGHVRSELLLLESVGAADGGAEVVEHHRDVRQQQSEALG